MAGSVAVPTLNAPKLDSGPSVLLAWARLLRAPNWLTVIGDPWAGTAVAMADAARVFPWPGWATVSVLGLYTAGILDNDITGLEEDRRVRPDRPLVTGAISLSAARRARLVAWSVGWGASVGAGVSGMSLAVLLTLWILLYHRVLHSHSWWGPAVLALCRGASLLMGAWSNRVPWEHFGGHTATALGIWMGWVWLLSSLARREATRPVLRRWVGRMLGALPMFQAAAVLFAPHPSAVFLACLLAAFAGLHAALRRIIPAS